MEEVWKPVPSLQGRYEASSLGRFRKVGGKIHAATIAKGGYAITTAFLNKKSITVCIHRAVCEAFHGLSAPDHEVNHLNYDRSDNRPDNLEWLSRKDNVKYSRERYARGSTHYRAKLDEATVKEIREKLIEAQYGAIRRVAREYGLHVRTVFRIKDRETWKHI